MPARSMARGDDVIDVAQPLSDLEGDREVKTCAAPQPEGAQP